MKRSIVNPSFLSINLKYLDQLVDNTSSVIRFTTLFTFFWFCMYQGCIYILVKVGIRKYKTIFIWLLLRLCPFRFYLMFQVSFCLVWDLTDLIFITFPLPFFFFFFPLPSRFLYIRSTTLHIDLSNLVS